MLILLSIRMNISIKLKLFECMLMQSMNTNPKTGALRYDDIYSFNSLSKQMCRIILQSIYQIMKSYWNWNANECSWIISFNRVIHKNMYSSHFSHTYRENEKRMHQAAYFSFLSLHACLQHYLLLCCTYTTST